MIQVQLIEKLGVYAASCLPLNNFQVVSLKNKILKEPYLKCKFVSMLKGRNFFPARMRSIADDVKG